jgi:hypothetical protein
MKTVLIWVALSVLGIAGLIAAEASREWWTSLVIFAIVFSGMKIFAALPTWWHALLGMSIGSVFAAGWASGSRSVFSAAVVFLGLGLAVVALYQIKQNRAA